MLYPERGPHRDTVFYDIFGPTIIATNVPVSHILDTRAVQINMPQARNGKYEMEVTPEAALPFKERLTAWRARTLGKPVPDCQKPAPGRLGDILKPLLQVVLLVHPDEEAAFRRLIGEIQRTRKIDRATSLEAQILLTIKKLEPEVYRGVLAVKAITDAFNEERPEREQLTCHRMARKLRSLGFEPAQTETSAAAIIWDSEKIARLFSAYGLVATSESSGTSGTSEEDSDDSDVFTRASGENCAEIFEGEL